MSGNKKSGGAGTQVANNAPVQSASANDGMPDVVTRVYASDVGCTAVVQSRFASTSADILRTSMGATLIRPDSRDAQHLSPEQAAAFENAMTQWQATALQLKATNGPIAEIDEKTMKAGIKKHGKVSITTKGSGAEAMDTSIDLPNMPGNPLQQLCSNTKPKSSPTR